MAMQQGQTPQVLNKKQLKGAVPNAAYIGRPSLWGNPFVIGKDGTRAEVVEKYERWLLGSRVSWRNSTACAGVIWFAGAHHCGVTATCCCGSRTDPGCAANDRSERRCAERSGCVTWRAGAGQHDGKKAPPLILPL